MNKKCIPALLAAFVLSNMASPFQTPKAQAMMLGESLSGCVSYSKSSDSFVNQCDNAANINYCVSGSCDGMDGVEYVFVSAGNTRRINLGGRSDSNLWFVACDTLPIWSTGANALEC